MFILGHMGIGSRLVSPWAARLPRSWLLFGTLLPDVIDKSLYYLLSIANDGKVGADLGLISSSRTIGHTSIFLIVLTLWASLRRSRIFAALALGAATHILLDNLGDRLMGARENSAALAALIFPLNGFKFAIAPFHNFKEHMSAIPNAISISAEILGAGLLAWDQWKLRNESGILKSIRQMRRKLKQRRQG